MAKKQRVNLDERIPWNGENHREQEYNEPTLTNTTMAVTPELLKGNIVTTGKDKQNRPLSGVEVKQDEVLSTDLREGMPIKVQSGDKEHGDQH